MTRRLMEKCRDELGRCYATRPRLKVAINLFADHFEDMSTVEDVRRIFATGGVAFGQVVLEVTERYPLSNLTRAKVAISALQELGCRVALDDAGTGHGGLAYLQKLGLDQIKIDKVFIDTITSTTASSPIVDSLTDLARSMRMEVVAEGVETIQQVEYLRRRGVDQAQGYLFAKPLPGPLYLDLIEAMESAAPSPASAPVDEPAGLRDAA
jgi:sensor c-di-GMP phosphodiesterase-like protein